MARALASGRQPGHCPLQNLQKHAYLIGTVQEQVESFCSSPPENTSYLRQPRTALKVTPGYCFYQFQAHKKSIRRATVNTFGYIAKAIGPHDVLATLLNNLKVQERQNRVCTTVAIAIVAETCSPFTVLPALMNEYRVPELNVQNGVLKVSRWCGLSVQVFNRLQNLLVWCDAWFLQYFLAIKAQAWCMRRKGAPQDIVRDGLHDLACRTQVQLAWRLRFVDVVLTCNGVASPKLGRGQNFPF